MRPNKKAISLPWHTFLLTAAPVLTLFVAGVSHFHWSELFLPVGIIWVVVILSLFVLFLWMKSLTKASIVVSFAGFFLLQFTYIKEIFVQPGMSSWFGEIYLIATLVFSLWLLWYFKRKSWEPIKLSKVLNLAAMILIGFQLVQWFQKDNRSDLRKPELANFIEQDIAVQKGPDSIHILYIVLDEYGRNDRLMTDFQIDNSDFTDYLEESGFQVSDKSRSNYWATAYSMSSSLNLQYLDTLRTIYTEGKDNWRILHHCINNARLFSMMREQGIPVYRTNTTLSEHVQFESEDHILQHQDYPNLDNLNYVFWQRSVMGWFRSFWKSASNRRYELHAQQINDGFDVLKDFYGNKPVDKSFVYAHFMVPHVPFIFNAEGPIAQHDVLYPGNNYNMSDEDWTRMYADQLAYVNSKVKEVIDVALTDTVNPPIIIIQGDHGARRDWGENKRDLDVESLDRFTNLSAMYLPGKDNVIPEDLTMVNTWRYVLNAYFNADLPLLEPHNFAIDKDRPFLMDDITSTLDSLEKKHP
jgi:hypothetical protein